MYGSVNGVRSEYKDKSMCLVSLFLFYFLFFFFSRLRAWVIEVWVDDLVSQKLARLGTFPLQSAQG